MYDKVCGRNNGGSMYAKLALFRLSVEHTACINMTADKTQKNDVAAGIIRNINVIQHGWHLHKGKCRNLKNLYNKLKKISETKLL